MSLTLDMITVDTTDPEPLAAWWAARFDAAITGTNDGWFVTVASGSLPLTLAFQKVDDPTPGKNRLHLDCSGPDLDGTIDALLAAGATLVERREMGGFHWVTLADPAGNQFCVAAH